MSRLDEALDKISNARTAIRSLRSTVAPVLSEPCLALLTVIDDTLGNIETTVSDACDVLNDADAAKEQAAG